MFDIFEFYEKMKADDAAEMAKLTPKTNNDNAQYSPEPELKTELKTITEQYEEVMKPETTPAEPIPIEGE